MPRHIKSEPDMVSVIVSIFAFVLFHSSSGVGRVVMRSTAVLALDFVVCFRCGVLTARCIVTICNVCGWDFSYTFSIFVSGRRLVVVFCCFEVSAACICCLDCCIFKKQLLRREVYGFHCYMEV